LDEEDKTLCHVTWLAYCVFIAVKFATQHVSEPTKLESSFGFSHPAHSGQGITRSPS